MPGQVALQVQQLRMQVVQLSRQKGRGDIQKLNEEMEKLQQEIQRRTALVGLCVTVGIPLCCLGGGHPR